MITDWGFQSYLDLKHRRVFTEEEYWKILRPNIELLKEPTHEKFHNPKFWGPATDRNGNVIKHGHKMKWHNIGHGKVQLRLMVVFCENRAFLCEAYVKNNVSVDKRYMAKLKNRIISIYQGYYTYRGLL